MIDGRVTFTSTDDERALLETAERHLLGEQDTDTAPGRGGNDHAANLDEERPS
jgi:hypothetical protein